MFVGVNGVLVVKLKRILEVHRMLTQKSNETETILESAWDANVMIQ